MKLSVVIPIYNEQGTLRELVARVEGADVGMDKELVLVDDCSTDRSREILEDLRAQHPEWKVAFHDKNQGKGAALRTGFQLATGELVIIQDADLEYDPRE